jgi:hypothetical protein
MRTRPASGAQSREERDQRRLAGAVRAEETEDLAGLDAQRDVVQHPPAVERLRQAGHFDRRLAGHERLARTPTRDVGGPSGSLLVRRPPRTERIELSRDF